MRQTYKVLAHTIAGFVAIQAAVMVFAVAGLGVWIADGNTLTEAAFEGDNPPDFTGAIGFFLHFVFGMMLIPLLALLLLIISFFAKIPGGVKWAAIIVGLVVLQITLGIFGHETPYAGLLHGLNALILFTTALLAGRRVETLPAGVARPTEDAAVR